MRKSFWIVLSLFGAFSVFAQDIVLEKNFSGAEARKGINRVDSNLSAADGVLLIEVAEKPAKPYTQGCVIPLDPKLFAGKKIQFSVEMNLEGSKLRSGGREAGKFMLWCKHSGREDWPQANAPKDITGWKKYSFTYTFPGKIDAAQIHLGLERAWGKIRFRNFKAVEVGAAARKAREKYGKNTQFFATLTEADSASGFWTPPKMNVRFVPDSGLEVVTPPGKGGFYGTFRGIPVKSYLGKRIRVFISAKAENLKPVGDTKTGGKFMLAVTSPKTIYYPQSNPATGTYDWKDYSFEITIPVDAKKMDLAIGTERGCGKIVFRNLGIEILDTLLDLSKAANMGLADKKAGDGKGGWSDQGPDNDARKFDFTRTSFANVPFKTIDPKTNGGKSVLTFKSSNFLEGLSEASVDLSSIQVAGKYLYLLHTMTWGSKDAVGEIEVTGKNGKKQTISIKGKRDVNDWWLASPGPNAHPAFAWTNSAGGIVGVFASVFPLNSDIGPIAKIRFVPKSPTAIWIILGATISNNQYSFPKAEIETTRENALWKNFTFPSRLGVIPGSALDRGTEKRDPVGKYGRVIINRDGKYEFEKKPGEIVHFFAALFQNNVIQPSLLAKTQPYVFSNSKLTDKEKIRDMVRSYRLKGYNMFRMHGIEGELSQKNGLDFPPEVFDNFFWAIKCMKDEGIYLNLDVAASDLGYYPGITWANWTWRKNHKSAKKHIYFDQDTRENWLAGARKVLLTVNPYTKMRLIDDPVLVNLIGFNEQEFIFSTSNPIPQAQGKWKEFLRKRYGSIDKLKAAWKSKSKWNSFDDLPVFTGVLMMETNRTGRDAYDFTRMMEGEIFDFYITNLRKFGWKGPFTNFNMGKSIQYVMAREKAGYVAMNSYHAHPSNYIQPGSTIDQSSSISTSANVARGFFAYQMSGKPYVITEQGHVFWNRHRYEQSFVTDGYSALQGIDGITAFIGQEFSPHGGRIHPFGGAYDPVMYAAEFLGYYIFGRGDVKPADLKFRLVLNEKDVLENYAYRWGIGSEQTRLTLLGRFALENSKDGRPVRPLGKKEIVIQRTGGSAVRVAALGTAGFTSIVDRKESVFDLDRLVRNLKKQGLVSANNRTDASREIFESFTGEIYLDAKKSFMSIDTPRLQGICALAGAKAKLGSFEVLEMERNGNLAAVSVDNAPSLEKSNRIVVVYATDAVNTGMVFNDSTRRVMQKLGKLPVLCETGRFSVALKNVNASKMKAFTLDLNGKRVAEIPVSSKNGKIVLSVDTGKLAGGPSLFFEIAAK